MTRRAVVLSGAVPSSMVTVGCATVFSLAAMAVGMTCDRAPSRHERWMLRGTLSAEAPTAIGSPLASPLHGGGKAV